MRSLIASRTIFSILIAGASLLSSPASAQISLVQVTTCGPGAFPSTSCTVPATGSGHLIAVGWSSSEGSAPTIASITDNANNVYVEAPNARAVDTTTNMVDIWYAKNSIAGATTLMITPSPSGSNGTAVIWEFSGVDTVSPLDQVSVLNSQPITGSPTGAAVTTTSPVEAVISVVAPQWWMVSLASGNAFTSDLVLNSPYASGWAHLITSSSGTYAAAWNTGADTYTSTTASFKAAGTYSTCDLNQDGAVNIYDVQVGTDMALNPTNCTAPYGQCNTAFANVVLTNAMGGTCTIPVLNGPASVGFGNVAIGGTSTQTAIVTGSGNSSTTITQAAASGTGFSVSGPTLPVTLAPNQTASFTVTFNPAISGAASGSVALTSNALTPLSIPLSGTGVTPTSHSVTLTWTASNPSTNIATYTIYRINSSSSTAPPTPYTSLASILATSCQGTSCTYTDNNVTAGQSYWYYAAAVDTSNNVSAPSNIVQAIIPTP